MLGPDLCWRTGWPWPRLQGVMLDTGSIQDPQLVNIGEESRVGFDVKVAGAMLVPAGIVDPDDPALVFSQVSLGWSLLLAS